MAEQDVQLPLSGNVTQSFFPLTINLGRSGDQTTEKDALSIASYGRQLGRVEDVLLILLKYAKLESLPAPGLLPEEKDAIDELTCMLKKIAKLKKKHSAKKLE